jgi:hypothetical protein
MDSARTAATRAKWYRKINRAYEKELRGNHAAANLVRRLAQSSDAEEISTLVSQTTSVGHRMLQIDAKKNWPTELDIGSVYGKWQQDWGMEAIDALERAISKRDDVVFEEAFAGNEALLNGKTNLTYYLRVANPEQTVSFFQYVLTSENP